MPVRRSEYDRVSKQLYEARRDTQSAYDRLDQALFENGKLLDMLEKERERSEMLGICLTDTLREALNLNSVPTSQDLQASDRASAFEPEMPKLVRDAIKNTFPGDEQIRLANESYAWSQKHRWNDASEVTTLADEILHGERV